MERLPFTHRRFLPLLGAAYAVWWGIWAISPNLRTDWWLEIVLVFFIIGFLLLTGRWFVFSRASYAITFVFLSLHTLGAHYTYSEVPYDDWFRAVTGISIELPMWSIATVRIVAM